ncbi:hypothetical protein TraAM80_04703 [Trypanosoma rangeli]|uniref:Uncharacterized protein n=1 Tax=Trypanosoma rangeli TaxID=5698 RepID=A0A422NI35_TRYRA|nr:uncharacterized protein TraAM80_04703 [Trypanosoma rangeli]RNF05143.1 hypothetical protein TraAM80_04703 [Trypanosoma rangeli]|eukprot:RNF05143.1 hypothetical protein TraAM80_04703 [Trypanosoma rangeli]
MWFMSLARVQKHPFSQSGAVICRHTTGRLRMRRAGAVACVAVTAVDVSFTSRRLCSNFLQRPEVSAKLLALMEAFAEARELIMEAKESAGTVYVAEDLHDAKVQTEKTLSLWNEIQSDLELSGDTTALDRLKREHSNKMSQLRAELADAEDTIDND